MHGRYAQSRVLRAFQGCLCQRALCTLPEAMRSIACGDSIPNQQGEAEKTCKGDRLVCM
jgi:hypothetical protein